MNRAPDEGKMDTLLKVRPKCEQLNLVPLSGHQRKVRFQASSAEFVTMLVFVLHSLSLWTLQYYSKASTLLKFSV